MAKDFKDFLNKENKIIKNPSVFEVSYLPEQIVKRNETYTFFKELSHFVNYGIPNHTLLVGYPGTGKTVTARHICEQTVLKEKGIGCIYINCRDKTTLQILSEIFEILNDGDFPKKQSGITEMIKLFLKKLDNPSLLVLDEIDRGRNIDGLLYSLSRTQEIDNVEHPPLSLVLISNNINWDESIEPAVRSSMQLSKIIFKPYSTKELIDILKQRARLGFFSSSLISNEEIKEIARRTYEKRGDCRVALKALLYAAQRVEGKNKEKIERNDIEQTFNRAIKDIEVERITRLRNSQLLILFACCQNPGASFTEVFDRYSNSAEQVNVNHLGQSMTYYWIEYLSNQGLIKIDNKKIKENGVPRKTLVITPLIDSGLVMEEIEKRMLKMSKE